MNRKEARNLCLVGAVFCLLVAGYAQSINNSSGAFGMLALATCWFIAYCVFDERRP